MRLGFAKSFALFFALLFCILLIMACGEQNQQNTKSVLSSRAYKGHEDDTDSNNLVAGFSDIAGTRIDDCQACHTAGTVTVVRDQGKSFETTLNPCSYCHLIPFPNPEISTGAPAEYAETLNPFGAAYAEQGRDVDAIRKIADLDSDGDGFSNGAELTALRYPGDSTSRPGQATIPILTLEPEQLEAMSDHRQLMLMNAHTQRYDDYALYEGVRIKDLLAALNISLTEEQSVTFIAPDGYALDFSSADINRKFPSGRWYPDLNHDGFEDSEQGFVKYPPAELLPEGMTSGGEIPGEQWIMLATKRDGGPLVTSRLDVERGRLNGEGPYRSVVPQGWIGTPGSPDRGTKYSPSGYDDGYDFDESKDHNSGLGVRGVVAMRINPIPAGFEEFDWKNGGFAYCESRQLIVYGAGVTVK
jgi:hypothetical protein